VNLDQQSTLDQLWNRTSTYRQSQAYVDTLRFVAAMRAFAPFNAYLLRIQRPNLQFAATADEWAARFGRRVRSDDPLVHPLVVLRAFGPVEFVYDLSDTEGPPLPEDLFQVQRATGDMDASWWRVLTENLYRRGIEYRLVPLPDRHYGQVVRLRRPLDGRKNALSAKPFPAVEFMVELNDAHDLKTRFFTLLHELAHVACGHLGEGTQSDWSSRSALPEAVIEFEAESVAFVVGSRLGLQSPSEKYLAQFMRDVPMVPEGVSITAVLTASWLVEDWVRHLSWPKKPQRQAAAERAREQRREAVGLGSLT